MNQGDLYISVKDIIGNTRSKVIGRNFMLSKTSANTIGRSRKNYIHISDESISKNHAVLRYLNDFQFQIEDLGSKHGTYVNNKKVYPKFLDHMNEFNERIENISKTSKSIDTLDQKLNIENKKYKAMKNLTKNLHLAKNDSLSIDYNKVDVGSNIRLGRVIFSIETADIIEGISLENPEITGNKDHSYTYRDQVNSNDLLEAIEVNKTVIETNKIFKSLQSDYIDALDSRSATIDNLKSEFQQNFEYDERLDIDNLSGIEFPTTVVGTAGVGYNILRRIGWDGKHSLGQEDNIPMNEPISVLKRPNRSGLGIQIGKY